MLMTKPRTSPYEQARESWNRVRGARRDLLDRHAAAQHAVRARRNPRDEADGPEPQVIRDQINAFTAGRALTLRQVERELEDMADEITNGAPAFEAAAQEWRAAEAAEAARLVETLRPRHRAAVGKIAAALEVLTAALEAERSLHRQLAESGLGLLASLPDASGPLGLGTLDQWSSPVSTWSREMRRQGLLP